MPNALNKEEVLRRCLADAGCDEALTAECLRRFREGTLGEMLPKLTAHRKCVISPLKSHLQKNYPIPHTNQIIFQIL